MKSNFYFLFLLSLLLSSISEVALGQNNLDSINIWIKQAKSNNFPFNIRKSKLRQAYEATKLINNDSLKADRLIEIAYRNYRLSDFKQFLKINSEAKKIVEKIKSNYLFGHLHWSYGTYYNKQSSFIEAYKHLNTAYTYFEKANEENNMGIMLQGMATLKGYYKDYSGSEKLDIKAIKIFKKLNNNYKLYVLYNHLGLLQRDIKEHTKAIEYYQKALFHYKKISKKNKRRNYVEIYNNIANIYFDQKEFEKALKFYETELKNKNLKKNQYARIIDNRAYCKLKMLDTTNVKINLLEALKIRDSLGNKTDILTSKIRLSDYFSFSKDTIKSHQYAKEANILAKEIKNGGDYLTTLKQLAALDKNNSKKYLDRYIEFNDSLVSAERRMRNKFTRIEFETDEYIEETERLSQQRIWIIVTSIGGILIVSLLYFLRVQKVNNEKLRIEAEHQKANEEVYVLTLQQQARVEEERIKERNRISEELHDGILGKLFGTRFGLGFLPLEGDDETLEKHQSLLDELQDIEKEIRDVSHKLSDNFNNTGINFTSIIKQLLEDKSIIGKFTHNIQFSQDISWKAIDEVSKANIYRIIQEALQNIIKHAKANHVSLNFELINDQLVTTIKDNGIGFDTKKGKRGIGIKNIKSRIEKLKGSIKIESEINVGTTLQINTPYIKKDGQ